MSGTNFVFNKWNSFWFAKRNPQPLSIYRVLIFSGLLVVYWFFWDRHESFFNCELYQTVGVYSLFGIPCSSYLFKIAYWAGILTAFLALLGLGYKWTGKLASLFALFVSGYIYNFHEVYHSYHMFIIVVLIVGFSRAGGSLSFDAWLQKNSMEDSWEFHWPLQMVRLYVVYVYWIVGIEKLYYGGFEWAFSENLQMIVFVNPQKGLLAPWFLSLSKYSVILIASWSLFVAEFLSPIALFGKKAGYFMWFNWLIFHIGVSLTLGGHLGFFSQVLCACVFLLPLMPGEQSRNTN